MIEPSIIAAANRPHIELVELIGVVVHAGAQSRHHIPCVVGAVYSGSTRPVIEFEHTVKRMFGRQRRILVAEIKQAEKLKYVR